MAQPARKIKAKGQETRRLLLEKAAGVFSERGFHAARVEEICAAAQVAKGTLYQYFEGKDEILVACFELFHDRATHFLAQVLKDPLRDALANREAFRNSMADFVRKFFVFCGENSSLVALTIHEPRALRETVGARFVTLRSLSHRSLDPFIQNAKLRGWVRSLVSSQSLALFSTGVLLDIAERAILPKLGAVTAVEMKEIVEGALAFLYGGLKFDESGAP